MNNEFAKWTPMCLDVEANGPAPGMYSMTEIGIVKVSIEGKMKSVYAKIMPLHDKHVKGALDAIGTTHEETKENAVSPEEGMRIVIEWVRDNTNPGTRPMIFSDNPAFDFLFYKWYAEKYCPGMCPFGYTARSISDIYRGIVGNVKKSFTHLRDTRHSHHPVDDAMGNAEALIKMVTKHDLKGLNIYE